MYLSYCVTYIAPKVSSGLFLFASESVLLLGILVNPKCDSFLDSAVMEACISRNKSNLNGGIKHGYEMMPTVKVLGIMFSTMLLADVKCFCMINKDNNCLVVAVR